MSGGGDTGLDAVVVGAGPNGLAAALTLAAHGLRVRVYEAGETPGGGCRTAELTLPGFRHDVCASVHPMAVASPFLQAFDPPANGVGLDVPEVAYAQPLDGGGAAVAVRSVEETAAGLGADAAAYRALFGPLARDAEAVIADLFGGGFRALPRYPLATARFGLPSLRSARGLAEARFAGEEARALFAGVAAHALIPLERRPTAAFGLLLAMLAHAVGWPVLHGGSQSLVDAMVRRLEQLGGEVVTGHEVTDVRELPRVRAVLLDVTPRQLLDLAGDGLPSRYRSALRRYRYGPGVFKLDYALDGPVPWTAERCRAAGTLHLGGTFDEIAASERATAEGRHPEAPYVLVVQASAADPTRAPAGKHTLWAYCHVPSGSTVDMTDAVERQVDRFAPGWRDLVLARVTRTAAEYERYDANYVGGDINGGVQDLLQTVFRPALRWSQHATPARGIYLCSSSTPPGGGVHGMCGYNAARVALRREFGVASGPVGHDAVLRTALTAGAAPA